MEKILRSLKDYGLVDTLLRILHRFRVISMVHTFEIIFKNLGDLKNEEINKLPENHRITMREIEEHELNQLKFAPGMYTIETLRMHFSKGMRFCAAFVDDKIVAVNGIHMSCADLIYIGMPNIILLEKVAYLNCAHTAPVYRNLSIGTALRNFRLDIVQKEGIEQVFGAVFIENKKAMRWNLRNGFQYWGRISYIKFGNKKFWWRYLTNVGRRYAYILNGAPLGNRELLEKIS